MKPWLWLPASWTHAVAPLALKALSKLHPQEKLTWKPLEWRGMHFSNRLGLAAGLDKDAINVRDWWKFGPGFLEVGTVVPKPQSPNPGKILDRSYHDMSVWNRMGFPSRGQEFVIRNLTQLRRPYPAPLLINIGKNRDTPLENAHSDYTQLIAGLHTFADAFVVNISSPNTQGLRLLLTPQYFQTFLGSVLETRNKHCSQKPILLKLSPDLTDTDLEFCLNESHKFGIDGWVLTNTTLSREPGSCYPPEGGVSGRPLSRLSCDILRKSVQILGSSKQGKLIVSVGGVLAAEDISERLQLGADLIEVYSGLIFHGPQFFRNVIHKLRL